MKVAEIVIEGEEIKKISDALYKNRDEYHADKPYVYESGDIVVLMREDYYFRISSTLMSVIILKFISENKVEIELVVSGGKNGALMYSWGAENSESRSIVHEIIDICNENSWEVKSIKPEDLKKSLLEITIDKFKKKIINPFK
ncbi:hypothetical protein [Alkaliphilus serpentinus]|uniref:Uncharacterized protein n=1 Tax=Alkaliphilus serpentinus TaxID=1482731 RepID=A0A833HNE8_9FIRM|nr:hypothetical protein [Alkaliphilus serpentinus]KAB3529517.1 hypothetical protein F8153_09105 [Alkaliphilus serpentinus]